MTRTWTTWMTMAVFAIAALVVTACAGPACEDGETQCSDVQVQTCIDGQWGEAADCETDMTCQAMSNGVEHCMTTM